MEDVSKLRKIRSFVRRDSRITASQQRSINQMLPQFTLPTNAGFINLVQSFGRTAPKVLEIGFGNGESLAEIAKLQPDHDFIGIETHQPGVGALLLLIEKYALSNIRIIYGDAVEILKNNIASASLDRLQVFFPDPWPKRKHHKRRLINPEFVSLAASRLKLEGIWHLATDWAHYGQQMMQVLSKSDKLINLAGAGSFAPRSAARPVVTKFEARGTQSGRDIWELQFARCD